MGGHGTISRDALFFTISLLIISRYNGEVETIDSFLDYTTVITLLPVYCWPQDLVLQQSEHSQHDHAGLTLTARVMRKRQSTTVHMHANMKCYSTLATGNFRSLNSAKESSFHK